MKKLHLIVLSVCYLLTSCATATYFGDKYPPTTTVDTYYSAHDVKKDYKVIGHLTYPNLNHETVKNSLVIAAMKIGADAIIITGTDATKDNQAAVVTADALKYTTK